MSIMMNIKQAKEEIRHTLQAYWRKDAKGRYKIDATKQRPVLMMGPPGIGKTAIMEQVARECEVGLVAYTITHHTRQSAVGLPMISEREFGGKTYAVTEYTMSEIIAAVYDKIEQTGIKEGILFIDEINCVSETLAPMMLQFLQCKTFGNWHLPEGWVIVAAGNPTAYNPMAREFDMVTLDRVKRLDIMEDFAAWKEYAYKQSVHEAILSYLEMKREHFYRIETTVDGLRFVTARAWEDLSQMLYAYEEADVAIEQAMIGAYVQDVRIARDFYSYYELYKKYKEHYQITHILRGDYDEELVQRFAGSSFDESISVLGLLLGALHEGFVEDERAEGLLAGLHGILGEMKGRLQDMEGGKTPLLQELYMKEEQRYSKEKDAGLLDREGVRVGEEVMERLQGYAASAKQAGCVKDAAVFDFCKEQFAMLVEEKKEEADVTSKKLEHAFAFIEKAFGSSQEMLIFVSELTADFYSMQFIARHGCEPYDKYSKELLYMDRRQELQEDIRKLL